MRVIADLHAQAGRAPVADLLKAFLDATHYRAIVMAAAGQARAARNVAKLLGDAHAGGMVSVGDFLAYVSALRDSGTREGEARATAEGAVQIMSVHAAKGLEFPVVVLGDVTYSPPARSSVLLDAELGVLLPHKDEAKARSAIYELGKITAEDQETAESHRLLYVAATPHASICSSAAASRLRATACPASSTGGWAASTATRGWASRRNRSPWTTPLPNHCT